MAIKFDKILGELRESDSGNSNGSIKYHLKDGDNVVVDECYEYFLNRKFILDNNSSITINLGAELSLNNGTIFNSGTIINNGTIENL